MKINKFFVHMSIVCSLLSSCKTIDSFTKSDNSVKTEISVKDSTSSSDSLFSTKRTDLEANIPLSSLIDTSCADSIPTQNGVEKIVALKEENNARVLVKVINDTLRIQATCDSIPILIKLLRSEHFRVESLKKDSLNNVSTLTVKKEQYVPWYIKILAVIGGITVTFIGFKAYNLLKFI